MKHLVSLPQHTAPSFLSLANLEDENDWFCTSDPPQGRVGSGGGTAWLLEQFAKEENDETLLEEWLKKDERILIHGGGQSRRLPSYAAMGKLLLPVPVFRWARGQRLNQTLLDLQLPLFRKLMKRSSDKIHTLVASGDAMNRCDRLPEELPDADIICVGMSVDPSLASRHGVFVCSRSNPSEMVSMLQKPSLQTIRNLAVQNLIFIDVGIWLLSDKAVSILMNKCGWNKGSQSWENEIPDNYDLYGSFGLSLGSDPVRPDSEIASLSSAVLYLPEGQFHHLGSSSEIISSSLALQNEIVDQNAIWSRNVKPHPAMFVQNSRVDISLSEKQANIWIENSHIAESWKLSGNQVLTGIPENDWSIGVPSDICIDISPVGTSDYVLRCYGMKDAFRGSISDDRTMWMNNPITNWLRDRNVSLKECDIQEAPLFPVFSSGEDITGLLEWMISGKGNNGDSWLNRSRLSASEIQEKTNLFRLEQQRVSFRVENWSLLSNNYDRSVFYQVDLDRAAVELSETNVDLSASLSIPENSLYRAHGYMFQSRLKQYRNQSGQSEKDRAFSLLQKSILEPITDKKVSPVMNVYEDQIVWARSPVRIDLAGGWTDTPPHCILAGGRVVTIALELNGQPPLQAFIRSSTEKKIILRSIDLGFREEIVSYEDLSGFKEVGSAFAIPKAALCLAGFHPDFSEDSYPDLITQLTAFGCGLEVTLLAAIPKGSGMGTSSILAATILGALSDFCNLNWDYIEIGNRTLALEQLLTTGGGWQDQYGGIVPGVKLLETDWGWNQTPRIRWLPDHLFTQPEYESCMLLYYTGITRVAKNLLSEIVEGMFLNERDRFAVLTEMKQHALDTWNTIQQGNLREYGSKIARSWELNNRLDAGTSNTEIDSIIDLIDDLCLGYKLPGAGGGGYLYIVAKDPDATVRIRKRLENNPPNPRARFVNMKLSREGMQISRS